MAIWEKLTNEELFFILRCDKFNDIVTVFYRLKQIPLEQWQQDARQFYRAEYDANIISQSIFSSLNDAPSYSLMTLLAIIGTVSIKVFALSLLTAGFSAIMLLAGVIFFAASHQELVTSRKKAEKFLDFATVKNQCAKELIKRQKQTIKNLQIPKDPQTHRYEKLIELHPFEYKNQNKLQKIKPAIGAALLTATMLFGTYYLGVSAIIIAFGATAIASALLGPIGLAIAITASVLLGIYCGYQQYQSAVATEKIEKQQKYAANEFNHNRYKCYELRDRIQRHCPHSNPIKKSLSVTDLSHRSGLMPASHGQRGFLMRRENLYRQKKTSKPDPSDPIIPSLPNNNFSHNSLR